MIQRNSVIPKYSMISAIRWSPAIRWSQAIWSSIGSIDFDSPKVYGDTSITGGLVYFCQKNEPCPKLSQHSPNMMPFHTWGRSWGVSSQEIRTLGQELGPWKNSSASGSLVILINTVNTFSRKTVPSPWWPFQQGRVHELWLHSRRPPFKKDKLPRVELWFFWTFGRVVLFRREQKCYSSEVKSGPCSQYICLLSPTTLGTRLITLFPSLGGQIFVKNVDKMFQWGPFARVSDTPFCVTFSLLMITTIV